MTAVKILWGPGSASGIAAPNSALVATNLNDADNAVGWLFCVPKDGTITDVGFYVANRVGTPPNYNCGIVTIDSSGRPTTTAYGGSAITAYSPPSTGWKWVTLDTGATAQAGDFAAVHVYPTATAPDASNYAAITRQDVAALNGVGLYYTTGWQTAIATSPLAVRYSDGAVVGIALSSNTIHAQIRSNTDPDEVGCKFTVPAAMTCYGARFYANTAGWGASAAASVVLYNAADGTVASATISDKDSVDDGAYVDVFWDAASLSAATTYRLILKPTVGSGGDIYATKWSFESTAALAAVPCGDAWQWTQRVDAGAWTDTNTAVAPMALWVSDITFSTTTAGGGAYAYIG